MSEKRDLADFIAETSPYPEHEKLKAVKEESQAIGEFLDYGPGTLCVFREAGDNGEPQYVWVEGAEQDHHPGYYDFIADRAESNPEYESWDSGYVPMMQPIEKTLADYFEIDLDKIEAEKRAMLESLRNS